MKILNAVVWGLGRHAIKNIIPAIQECKGINLYGVCSRNKDIVAKIVIDYKCKGWLDPKLMLDDNEVDIVYLATPIALHFSQGEASLLASKHLWCEKPFTQQLNQTEELVNISRIKGISIRESFMYLYHPQFLHLRKIIKSGRLGEIQNIYCRFGIPPLENPGFRNSIELGGSAISDVGCYPISIITALFPEEEIEVITSEIDNRQVDAVDKSGRTVLRFGKLNIILEWSTITSYRNEIDIWGTDGSVFTDRIFSKSKEYTPYFNFKDIHGNIDREDSLPANHFLEMITEFVENIADKENIERERKMILKRARLMDKILNIGILNQV
ncbi:MAG: Gfo/Idh/MocA family oxidoreductase [Chitinophagaceae bacterium]|nr:Gfo/Idh/MocA family oxidoreductase [Chitinophagaceae bacterium]